MAHRDAYEMIQKVGLVGPSLFILLEGFLVEPGPEDGQSCRIFDLVFSPKRSVLIS